MARDYARLLHQLLPPGDLWRTLGGTMQNVIDALAVELARVDQRALDLEAEMMPATSVELLEEWETALGLPDGGCELASTTAGRQAAAQARFTARGRDYGAGVLFLTAVAERLGYAAIEIRRFYREGFNCDSECVAEVATDEWMFVWEVIARHGDTDAQLVCELRNAAFKHVELQHSFPLFLLSDATYTRVTGMAYTHPQTGSQSTLGADEPGLAYLAST